MSHIDQTIADLQRLLREQEEQVRGTKRTINSLLQMAGREPAYAESEISGTERSIYNIPADKWYGQPLATAIREYLTMRRSAGQGPATVTEIHEALAQGGFAFDAKNDDYAKRGLRSSLTKNPVTFHRLPDGKRFGLTEWYPKARDKTVAADAGDEPAGDKAADGNDTDTKGGEDE